jgi:hypothetical protein
MNVITARPGFEILTFHSCPVCTLVEKEDEEKNQQLTPARRMRPPTSPSPLSWSLSRPDLLLDGTAAARRVAGVGGRQRELAVPLSQLSGPRLTSPAPSPLLFLPPRPRAGGSPVHATNREANQTNPLSPIPRALPTIGVGNGGHGDQGRRGHRVAGPRRAVAPPPPPELGAPARPPRRPRSAGAWAPRDRRAGGGGSGGGGAGGCRGDRAAAHQGDLRHRQAAGVQVAFQQDPPARRPVRGERFWCLLRCPVSLLPKCFACRIPWILGVIHLTIRCTACRMPSSL